MPRLILFVEFLGWPHDSVSAALNIFPWLIIFSHMPLRGSLHPCPFRPFSVFSIPPCQPVNPNLFERILVLKYHGTGKLLLFPRHYWFSLQHVFNFYSSLSIRGQRLPIIEIVMLQRHIYIPVLTQVQIRLFNSPEIVHYRQGKSITLKYTHFQMCAVVTENSWFLLS